MISNFLINVVPDHPITKKPLGARMGGGRGEIVCYGQWVAEGDVIVEFETRNKRNVPIVARRVASAIPLQIDVVTKEEARFSVNAHLVPTFISERLHRLEIHKLAQRPVKGYIQ